MQQPTPLIGFLCLVALVAFGASAVLGVALLMRRRQRAAPRASACTDDVPLMPALPSPPSAPVRAMPPPAPGAALPYAAIPTLLTNAEQQFFAALEAAVPDGMLICPQVRLANLVRPTARKSQQKNYDFYRIQAKCVDFVLCDRVSTAPRLVIELDDASHARPDRRVRDAFVDAVLATVRLPVLHVRWQCSYDAAQLAAAVRHALSLEHPVVVHNARSAADWATPIAVAPRATMRDATAALPQHRPRYVCGACQGDVPRDSRFCHQCDTILARR